MEMNKTSAIVHFIFNSNINEYVEENPYIFYMRFESTSVILSEDGHLPFSAESLMHEIEIPKQVLLDGDKDDSKVQ